MLAHRYRVFVFVRDCLVTDGMRIAAHFRTGAGRLFGEQEGPPSRTHAEFTARRAKLEIRAGKDPNFAG